MVLITLTAVSIFSRQACVCFCFLFLRIRIITLIFILLELNTIQFYLYRTYSVNSHIKVFHIERERPYDIRNLQ